LIEARFGLHVIYLLNAFWNVGDLKYKLLIFLRLHSDENVFVLAIVSVTHHVTDNEWDGRTNF
jgi:hypothetical protein